MQRVEAIAREHTARESADIDRDFGWPSATMSAMCAEGLAGLVVPVEHGGLGQGLPALVRVCEALGRESGSAGLVFGMHSVAAAVISAKPTEKQAQEFLRPIAAGEHVTTLALSEPGTGSHFYFPETQLTATDAGYRIEGEKSFVTSAGKSDSYVVSTVAADPQAPPGHFSCLIVPSGQRGVEPGPPWQGVGMRGNSSRNVSLRGVEVPEAHLLGTQGDQIWYVFNVVAPYFLMAMAGTYLGLASRAVEEAINGLDVRIYSNSGRGPADSPVVQHRLGELWTGLQRTRQLIYWAADEADRQGALGLPALCAAKAEVAGSAVRAINGAMSLLGGRGYRAGGVLERLLRDSRAADVMSPTTDILLTWCGRALLDQPLLSDD